MRCRKGGEKWKKVSWRWEERVVEVREYKYLGYIIKYNGKQEVYIRERMRKGVAL